MTNNKQSSVEYFIEQVKSKEWKDMFIWHKEEIFEQAKQMEKEQRNKDYHAGYMDAQCNHVNDAENYIYESSSRI